MTDGFQSADVSCDEGENRDPNATLRENAKDGKLEKTWTKSFAGTGEEKIGIEGSCDMGCYYEEGCDSSKTLLFDFVRDDWLINWLVHGWTDELIE